VVYEELFIQFILLKYLSMEENAIVMNILWERGCPFCMLFYSLFIYSNSQLLLILIVIFHYFLNCFFTVFQLICESIYFLIIIINLIIFFS